MKKLLALLLAIVMVMSFFAACGSRDDEEEDRKKEPVSDKKEEETEGEETPAGKDFTLGEVDGQTYENTFIGIGCRLPSGWTYLSEEELKEANQIAEDLVGDALTEAYQKATILYPMMATSPSVENCNLNMEKLDKQILEKLDIAGNNEKLLPMMEAAFENMGASSVLLELGTVKLDGKTFDCINTHVTLSGVEMVQCILSIKCDGYLANLSLTAANEENLEELLDCFYLLK